MCEDKSNLDLMQQRNPDMSNLLSHQSWELRVTKEHKHSKRSFQEKLIYI